MTPEHAPEQLYAEYLRRAASGASPDYWRTLAIEILRAIVATRRELHDLGISRGSRSSADVRRDLEVLESLRSLIEARIRRADKGPGEP